MTTGCYGLRDDQWERIKDWLPGREGAIGVIAKDNRRFEYAMIDSTIVRAHQHSAGAKGGMPTPKRSVAAKAD